MLSSMSLELQTALENYKAYDMIQELKTMFEEQANQELFEIVKAFHACKQEEGQSVSSYLLKMKSYLDILERSGYAMPNELGEAAYILGIKIMRDKSKQLITLSQSAYLEKTLKKSRMENSKKGYTPMMEKPDYRKSQGAKTHSESFLAKSYKIYWTAVKTILKYLRNTKNMVLVYEALEAELKISCYADASFQTDKDDTKSQTRYMFVLNGGAVDWKSSKQSVTAMSSTEAEYIVAAEASMEAV
nr:hypothetical protein [Tanacetum cinerariifolium]